jgi:outer membrane lipoprotein-sorting protein
MVLGSYQYLSSEVRTVLAASLALGLTWGILPKAANAQGQTEVQKSAPKPAEPAAQPAPETAPAPAPTEPAAATPPAEAQAPSPIGSGANWQADTTPQPSAAEPQADPAAVDVVLRVNEYFNGMTSMQGSFVQTDPDNKQKRGKFFFERPGKVRFDYAAPSKLVIVSDGSYLAIEDHDLKTTDRYPLNMTPFRLLLSEKVDLLTEARILSVDQGPEVVVLTVEDKSSDSGGRIRLFFGKENMVLQQWIITDPQGLDTRVQLADLETNKQLEASLFSFSKNLGFRNLSQ